MNCQSCNSERVADITGKCSDCCSYSLGKNEQNGYVPSGMGVGGGDYIEFAWCLDCGQLQGTFPIPSTAIEKEAPPSDIKDFFENHFVEGHEVDSYLAMQRRRLISEAEYLSLQFKDWFSLFLSENLNKYPPRRLPSAEHFVHMYESGAIYIEEQS